MAARADSLPPVEDDPLTASDAVSLHTIAEQADAYEAQQQEDADFALALALEEQESARFARTQRILHPESSEPTATGTEPSVPYRDEPGDENDIDPPPYRDDPDAEPAEGQQDVDAEAAGAPPRRQNVFLRIIRKILKAWVYYLIWSIVFTMVIVMVVLTTALFLGDNQGKNKGDPKEAAWLASGSTEWDLNLPKLYPALEETTQSQCKKDWERLAASLPCHRMILSSAWDNGNATEAKEAGADPVYYRTAVCTRECKDELKSLDESMRDTCFNRSNHFDFDRYGKDGKAYFESDRVEEGPADVPRNLLARYDRLCSGPPKKYIGQQPPSCAEHMWMTWGIVDGKNEATLNGLETFLEQTSVKKTIPGTRQEVVKLMRSGQNRTFTRKTNSRSVGPGRGQTECTDCERDWFKRKMLSFRYGEVVEPGTRNPLTLADFADKMKNASQRCYAYNQQETRIWEAAGLWCDGSPCRKDTSIPVQVMNVLHGYDTNHGPTQPDLDRVPAPKKQAVRTLLTAMQNMRCAALGISNTDLSNPLITSASFLTRLCSPRCLNSLDRIAPLLDAASYPNSPATLIKEYAANVHTLCRSTPDVAFTTSPEQICAPAYASLNLTHLISSPSSSSPSSPLCPAPPS